MERLSPSAKEVLEDEEVKRDRCRGWSLNSEGISVDDRREAIALGAPPNLPPPLRLSVSYAPPPPDSTLRKLAMEVVRSRPSLRSLPVFP